MEDFEFVTHLGVDGRDNGLCKQRHIAISKQRFSENQASQSTAMATVAPPAYRDPDTCPGIGIEYGTTAAAAAAADTAGSTLIRFGTTTGDVSLTLGLRHAGNVPEKNPFSVRGFGGFKITTIIITPD